MFIGKKMKTPQRKYQKEQKSFIFGIHPIVSALEKFPQVQKELWVQKDLKSPMLSRIKNLCLKSFINVQEKDKNELDLLTRKENHQGVVLFTDLFIEYSSINDMKNKSCVLILDHLEDPHNFGAILRTCEQFGVDGVVIPKNRSVGVTATVMKVSSGAAFLVPIIQESSLLHAVEKLKEFGFWIYTTDVNEGDFLYNTKFTEKVVIIMGNESSGVSAQLAKNSDFKVRIPSYSQDKNSTVDSLNVSVASAVMLYGVRAYKDQKMKNIEQ